MEQTPCQLLKPLLVNEHWILMEEYLAGEKSRLVTRLCNCNDLSELKELQGHLKMIEKLLYLKQQLKTEQGSRR
jgi:hypothetical protein